MKNAFVIIGYGLLCLVMGAVSIGQDFNREISGVQYKILGNICNKNDGIKTIRRAYFKPEQFVIKCNDTAIFDNVSFNLQEKEPQS